MKHFSTPARNAILAFAAVSILCLIAVSQLAPRSGAAPGNSSSVTAEDSLFRNATMSLVSRLDGSEWLFEIEDAVVRMSKGNEVVLTMPADILARSGDRYHSFILADSKARTEIGVDTDRGTYTLTGTKIGYLADLLLGAVSVVFAIAFFVTGFFLLQMARQRRELNESRIRQLRAREAERTHLAAELHDGPVQDLQHVMRSYFGAFTDSTSKNAAEIVDIQAKLENVTAALRNICTELRPPVLAHFGLAYAIRSYADRFQSRLPFSTIHLIIDDEESVGDDQISLAFYRIFQEALSNIEKHARAENIWIKLHIDPSWVELVIADDGIGFEPPRDLERFERDGHLGLSGLAQRAEAVGGVFEVRSSEGTGTTIRVVARRLSDVDRDHAQQLVHTT
ncbi:MAG: sensor histidine kinase [Rhodothermales bacterium]|nr:sensor histidine kinase [Rhodothermales bacterium]